MSGVDRPDACRQVLAYLFDAYSVNPEAEVAAREITDKLSLPGDTVLACIEYLVMEGLASADLFPVNVWVTLTEEGANIASQQADH